MKILYNALIAISIASVVSGCTVEQAKEVQAQTVAACKFLPTIETISAIFTQSAYLTTGSAIASQICNAVTNLPLADGPGGRVPRVGNVVVVGRFVK